MMTHLEKHGFITYKKYSYLTGLLKNNIPKDSNRSIQKKKTYSCHGVLLLMVSNNRQEYVWFLLKRI